MSFNEARRIFTECNVAKATLPKVAAKTPPPTPTTTAAAPTGAALAIPDRPPAKAAPAKAAPKAKATAETPQQQMDIDSADAGQRRRIAEEADETAKARKKARAEGNDVEQG